MIEKVVQVVWCLIDALNFVSFSFYQNYDNCDIGFAMPLVYFVCVVDTLQCNLLKKWFKVVESWRWFMRLMILTTINLFDIGWPSVMVLG